MRPRPLGPASRRTAAVRPGNAVRPLAQRFARPLADTGPADPVARSPELARVEAALFLADEPLTARRLAEVANLPDAAVARRLVEQLRAFADAAGTAFRVEDLAGGYQLLTRPVFHPWLLRLRRTGHDLRLTPAAMETLAVIAYKQPVTRADVEAVRGVGAGEVVRVLMEKGLVKTAGRDSTLGRPQLYGTTKKFLQAFGLVSLADLPVVDSLRNPG
ncbi:MAG: SMC-Scp complex subunit ScpB [Fimbriiglobus sp.]